MSLLAAQPLYVPLPTPQLIATSGTSAVRRCPPRSSQPSLGCSSLPAPQLTASPRLSCPPLAACVAYVFCRVPLCSLPSVFGAAQLPAPRSLPSDVSSAQLRAPCSLPCMLCQLSFPPLAAFSFGGSSTVGSLGAFSAACPV